MCEETWISKNPVNISLVLLFLLDMIVCTRFTIMSLKRPQLAIFTGCPKRLTVNNFTGGNKTTNLCILLCYNGL